MGHTLEVPQWGLFETAVSNANHYANPFTDVSLSATFTRPDGSTVSFQGFHDGDGKGGQTGRVWKLRFMPDQVGAWKYACTFSDGAPAKNGSFKCVAAGAKPGPLRVDPENPRWFKFADGSRMHLHGYYYLDYWSDFDDAWRNRVHNIVLADGYTLVMPMSFIRGPERKGELRQDILRTYIWIARGDTVAWDRFDLATWKRLDERLAWAAAHNMVVYTFDGLFPQSDYGAKPIPADREDLYLRYSIARHAPYWNVLWNLGAEMWKGRKFRGPSAPEKNYGGSGYTPAQVHGWAQKIKDLDPWDHPVSWHDQGQGSRLSADERAAWSHSTPAAGYAVLQNEFRAARPAYDFAVGNYFHKPLGGCECNWESLYDIYNKPRNRTEVRRGIWGISLAGGVTMYADWTADYDPRQNKTTRRVGYGKGRADVKRMNQFLSRLPWWTMGPHTELVADADDVCLAAIGQHYIVYSESGQSITLNLPPGAYAGEWFNPVEGGTPSAESIASFAWRGGRQQFHTPANVNTDGLNDWVLQIWATPKTNRSIRN